MKKYNITASMVVRVIGKAGVILSIICLITSTVLSLFGIINDTSEFEASMWIMFLVCNGVVLFADSKDETKKHNKK
ncbi:MAG: hypothetical protein U0L20_00260 [Ruminococcus sp.]|nr:hypothetical protein [Ruminococcus sp.]